MKLSIFCIVVIAAGLFVLSAQVSAVQRCASLSLAVEPKDDDDRHKGEQKPLGEKPISGYTVKVTQSGDVKAGEEAVFVIVLSGGSGKPKTVRGWVGVESGERSIKTKADDEGAEYHLHHEVSKPLPKDSKLWIEIETSTGKQKASFDTAK